MAEHGYLKFTGEYAKLKTMGYKFSHMFAGNYMAWSKNGIFIYKKGSDITSGNFDLYQLVKFFRGHPTVRTHSHGVSFYQFYTNTDTNEYEYHAFNDENREKYRANMDEWRNFNEGKDEAPQLMSMISVSNKIMDQLKELNDLGWYELAFYDEKD